MTGALRVGLDVSPVVNGTTGVAQYAIELVRALEARADVDPRTFAAGRGVTTSPIVIDRRVRVPLRVLHPAWRLLGRPRAEDLVGPIDVVHAIDTVPPPSAQPVVLTCHDVLPLTHPEHYDERYRRLSSQHVASFASVAAIVTTCAATAAAIEDVAGLARERLVVAPPGRRLGTSPDQRRPATDPFVLVVGAITPRKGLHRLVAALARLDDPPRVVVAGPDGMRAAEVHAALAAHRSRVPVELRGRVDDAALADLFATATLLCHPSEAEGFGIPVLEAMGAGLPVVASDIAPTRELAGDTAVLVPPDDPAAWADAVAGLLADPDRRDRLAAAAAARAAPYTWERMADRIVDCYRQVI